MTCALRVVALVVALAACGSDSHGGPYVPIEMFNTAYKDAYCTYLVACSSFADHDTCMRTQINGPVMSITADLEAAVLAGKLYYDGGRYAACLETIAKTTCDQTDADGRLPTATCTALFRGALAANAVCAFDEECVSQSCARTCGELTCCLGTCLGGTAPTPAVPKVIGQDCTGSTCVATAYCEPSTQVCTDLKPTGMPCAGPDECALGLGCLVGPRTCGPLPKLGDGCSLSANQCRDDGQYCDETATCVAFGLPGAACDPSSGQPDGGCSPYDRCDVTTSTCVAYPALGQSCTNLFECADSAGVYCDTLTRICTASHALGETCNSQSNACVDGLYCDGITQKCTSVPTCI